MTDDDKKEAEAKSLSRGWIFVALQPEQLFIVHTLLRLEIRKARKTRNQPRNFDAMLMAEFIMENACTSLVGMSAEE